MRKPNNIIWLIIIYLRSNAKKVSPTYINLSRNFIQDGTYLMFVSTFEWKKDSHIIIRWALNPIQECTRIKLNLMNYAYKTKASPLEHRCGLRITDLTLLTFLSVLAYPCQIGFATWNTNKIANNRNHSLIRG